MNTVRIRKIVLNLEEVQYIDISENRCRVMLKGRAHPLEIACNEHERELLAETMECRGSARVYRIGWWYSLSTVWGIIVCILVAFMGIFGFRH